MTDESMRKVQLSIADTSPAITFIFCLITLLFWAMYRGIIPAAAGSLTIGIIQLALFPPYLVCATLLFKRGDMFGGIIYMIFAALFGGVGGLFNVTIFLASWFGFSGYLATIGLGLAFGLSAVIIVPYCYVALRTAPAAGSIMFICADLFLFLYLFMSLGWLGAGWAVACEWLALAIVVLGMWNCCSAVLASAGFKPLPAGPVLWKMQDESGEMEVVEP